MKNRECPHCHEQVSVYRTLNAQPYYKEDYSVICNHCKRTVLTTTRLTSWNIWLYLTIGGIIFYLIWNEMEHLLGFYVPFVGILAFLAGGAVCYLLLWLCYKNKNVNFKKLEEK